MYITELGAGTGKWKSHSVRQFDGVHQQLEFPAGFQVVNEPDVNIQAPVMRYLPEKNRIIILAAECILSSGNEGEAVKTIYNTVQMTSDDLGNTWSFSYPILDNEGNPVIHWCDSLEYMGKGHVIFHSSDANALGTGESSLIWSSSDYGCTWDKHLPFLKENDGKELYLWGDGIFAGKHLHTDETKFVIASGFRQASIYPTDKSIAGFRISFDSCRTWSDTVRVPEWHGFNEVSVIQAANGDLVAALRKDMPKKFHKSYDDNCGGMGTSYSTDGGATWSEVQIMYDWGRHFPSMVLLPNDDIVMTYVVRRGYPNTEEGYPQFGIEAVVSHNNGRTWDLDYRYILADWKGKSKGPFSWLYGCQSTSTVLLPDGYLLTTFSYGPESNPDANHPKIGAKYDIGLVRWKLNSQNISNENTMTLAPFYSDMRNKTDNRPQNDSITNWKKFNNNVAIKESGALVTASLCDYDPSSVLYDRYTRPFLTFETIPAWIEISWPQEHLINEIHIHPGAPSISTHPETECVPLDYRLQYTKDGEWVDIIPPVVNAKRYDGVKSFTLSNDEFEYVHKFSPMIVKSIRIYITRSSDSGKRRVMGDRIVVQEEKRKTILRWIEVIEVNK